MDRVPGPVSAPRPRGDLLGTDDVIDEADRLTVADPRESSVSGLGQSEGRLMAILESALDCVVTMDHEGRIVEFNPAAEATFGYVRQEVLGRFLADTIIPPYLRERHREGLARFLKTGEAPVLGTRLELPAMRSDGSEFPAEVAITRVHVPGPPLFTGWIRDLTERKREEARSRLAAIVESSEDAIIGRTLEGVITSWNAGAERLYGYSAQEAVGRSIEMLVPPERREEPSEIVDRVQEGVGVEDLETVRMAKNGVRVHVSLSVSPIRDEDGTITGASTIARNITERKRAEEAAKLVQHEQAAREAAEEASHRLERLQTISDAALAHLDLGGLLQELLHRIRTTLGGDMATALLLSPDGRFLVPRASSGLESEVDERIQVPVGEGIAGVIATRRAAMVVNDVSSVSVVSPVLREKVRSLIGAPLTSRGELLGVLVVGTFTPREFSHEDVGMLQLVADRVAMAVSHARLYEAEHVARGEAEAGRRRLAFLAEASKALGASLDYSSTLGTVADLAVPDIADWCVVDLIQEDGSAWPVAIRHPDPERAAWARQYQERNPPNPNTETLIGRVLTTGTSQLLPEIPDQVFVAEAPDEETLQVIRELGLKSAMIVPLPARGRILGAITFVSTVPDRRYGPADLAVAEELGRHAGQAIDNARLYREAQERADEVLRLNAELEARVVERTAQLEAAVKELEAFSYSVSHDLRAPLRAMDGFSRILLNEYGPGLPEQAQGYLGIVREGAQQMGHLIDDLLTFARLSRQPLKKQPVDLGDLITACIQLLGPELQDRGIEIIVGHLPPALGDPALLKQVFLNLLMNAVKFTRPRESPLIEVGFRHEDGERVYFVKDNGVGFDMDHASKLFGVFQRLHRAEDYEGTGVGLAIVQRVIHRHGGRVWAEAAEERGATFFLTLEGAGIDD